MTVEDSAQKPQQPPSYSLFGVGPSGQTEDLLAVLSDGEGRQRLQALIAEWLRMENLVILTGAGCSVSQGGKIIAKLEDAVLEAVRGMDDLSAPAKEIVAEREAVVAIGLGGSFEQWLSFVANAHYLSSDPNSPLRKLEWRGGILPAATDLSDLIRGLSAAISAECALLLKDGAGEGDKNLIAPHLAFLSKLVARDSNLGRAHLFTLNYDTLFEQALELLGIQYFDGFTGSANARFDPSVYGLDIYYPGEIAEGRVRRFDKFLHLYKLHGSIHWQVKEGELRAHHPDLALYSDYLALNPADKARRLKDLVKGAEVGGIMPTSNKFVQTLSMPYGHLFRLFQVRLSAPQTFLLVLGYGFGDDHVTRIIETALMNPSLVMLIVEPNPESQTIDRVKKYKDLGKRAFVLTASAAAHGKQPFKMAGFDDFAKSTMPDVRWLDDFLRLRKFEKQLQVSDKKNPEEGQA